MRTVRGIAASTALGLTLLVAGCGVAGDKLATKAPAVNNAESASGSSAGSGSAQRGDGFTPDGSQGGANPAKPAVKVTSADLVSAAQATKQIDSARFDMTFSMDDTADMAISMKGAFDNKAKTATMTMASDVAGGSFEYEMRMIDDAVYMKMGDLGGFFQMPEGKSWIKIPAEGDAAMGAMSGSQAFEPTELLTQLESVTGSVETLGTETLDGVKTTHYKATLDSSDVAAMADKAMTNSMLDGAGDLEGDLGEAMKDVTIPLEIWIGDDGYVHQFRLTIEGTDFMPGDMVMTMRFFDFGTKVDVVAPPADQVVDAKDALGGMLGDLEGAFEQGN